MNYIIILLSFYLMGSAPVLAFQNLERLFVNLETLEQGKARKFRVIMNALSFAENLPDNTMITSPCPNHKVSQQLSKVFINAINADDIPETITARYSWVKSNLLPHTAQGNNWGSA